MTETERKALALLREVEDERGTTGSPGINRVSNNHEALCRAIEQHEAFRQEVSDAVQKYFSMDWNTHEMAGDLRRFIITKPDPLVEALCEMDPDNCPNGADADNLRAAIEKRGGKIVWGEDE